MKVSLCVRAVSSRRFQFGPEAEFMRLLVVAPKKRKKQSGLAAPWRFALKALYCFAVLSS